MKDIFLSYLQELWIGCYVESSGWQLPMTCTRTKYSDYKLAGFDPLTRRTFVHPSRYPH